MEKIERLLEKADSGQFTKREVAVLSEATRAALKHMLSEGLPITPKNFEYWFLVFLYLILEGKYENYTERDFEKACNLVTQFVRKRMEEEKELKDIKEKTEQVLALSYENIGNILKSVKEHNDILEEQIRKLKDFETKEGVEVLINTLLQQIEELRRVNRNLQTQLDKAHKLMEKLKERLSATIKKANTDPLTGLYNRGFLEDTLRRKIKHFEKTGEIFSIIMADLDNFKRVNDLYGHLAGDEVLITFADILRRDLRMDDIAARYGGEEFTVVLSKLDMLKAISVANRLRSRLESTPIIWGEDIIRVTASFGVAQVAQGDTPETLLERADKALYLAKSEGKNCVRSEKDVLARMGD